MKKFFFRGLGALLPMVLTVVVFYLVGKAFYEHVGMPLGSGIRWIAVQVGIAQVLDEEALQREIPWIYPTLGILLGFFILMVVGFLVATFLGKRLITLSDAIFKRIPILRVIYPYAKQLSEFLFSAEEHKKMEFKSPVAVPFPGKGMYSIGFITSEGIRHLNEVTGKNFVCVFIPTSPTPFTGFIVYYAREEIIPLPLSVDDALRLFISAGVITPAHQAVHLSDPPVGRHRPMPAPGPEGEAS